MPREQREQAIGRQNAEQRAHASGESRILWVCVQHGPKGHVGGGI